MSLLTGSVSRCGPSSLGLFWIELPDVDCLLSFNIDHRFSRRWGPHVVCGVDYLNGFPRILPLNQHRFKHIAVGGNGRLWQVTYNVSLMLVRCRSGH